MKHKLPPRRSQRWWPFRYTSRDFAVNVFEERERDAEAAERDQRYKQNAFAALSPTPELLWHGALAGFQVGAALLAVETALLIAILGAAASVGQRNFMNLYGSTPLSGTVLEPLWPVALSLPLLLFFGLVGAVAALARRAGILWLGLLDRYYESRSPRLDLITFWGFTFALMVLLAQLAGVLSAQPDPTGVLTLVFCASGLIAWPGHELWLRFYLPAIRARGSASIDAITERIHRQR